MYQSELVQLFLNSSCTWNLIITVVVYGLKKKKNLSILWSAMLSQI